MGAREKRVPKKDAREKNSQKKNSVVESDGKEAQMKCSERNTVLAPRSMELPRSSDQIAFPKIEKVQECPGRRACPVLSSAQTLYSAST
jgi:hypothetical protein